MSDWVTWRSVLVSIVIGVALSVLLFYFTEKSFTLSGLELFFAVTTLISLGLNLWQLIRDRYKYSPLKNSLIGLFNDLKGRQLRAYNRQQLLYSVAAMTAPIEAVRLEFYDSLQEAIQNLGQLREHVVACIHTIDPGASTERVYQASEFGLSEDERRLRAEYIRRATEAPRQSNVGPQEPAEALRC